MNIWQKIFSKITFKDYPDVSTPINATNLNVMTNAIDGLDDRVVESRNDIVKILGNMAAEYDETSTYDVGSYVIYNGLLYKCIVPIEAGEVFNPDKWEKTDCGVEFGILNSNLTNYIIIQQTSEDIKYLANQRTMITPIKPIIEGYEAYLMNARHVSTTDIALTGISNNTVTFFNSYNSEYTFNTWFDWILVRKVN